jgi:chromosome segregation ATPase
LSTVNGNTDGIEAKSAPINELNEELKSRLEKSQQSIDVLNEQIIQLNIKLGEMKNAYEQTKQSELDERNKNKHLEKSVRALKIEKDQLLMVIFLVNLKLL